jgi:glycolate oxidase
MSLSRDAYRELEDILGPDNISEDLAVLEGYAYLNVFGPMSPKPEDRFMPRPEAVVLPGTADEVQAIIKLCRRKGIRTKAFSTGYGPHNSVGGEGVIMLDLRRMNRIIDIDEKNMFIVVEPYVSSAQVHAEAMKRGMGFHIAAAGSQVSALAGHTSMHGNNFVAISQGYSGRNLLGVEWVLPTGDLVRLGSLGAGAGWFSGDGPGPSLRGIMRGAAGALGSLGVFTKCACHLHPWPGPRQMKTTGVAPKYEAEIPPLFEYHIVGFPSWDHYAAAVYKIGEAGIAYALHKTGGPGTSGVYVTGSNNEYCERRANGEFGLPRHSFAIIMGANSEGEHVYQKKVFETILAETGGEISPVGEDETFKKHDYLHLLRVNRTPSTTGGFTMSGIMAMESMDNVALGLKTNDELVTDYQKKGLVADDGTSNSWSTAYEGTHFALAECGHGYDILDEETYKGVIGMPEEGMKKALALPLCMSWCVMGDQANRMLGPFVGNVQDWMRKVKRTFDPDCVSDPTFYISPEEGPKTNP